ncbi:MAG: 16S rRNA (cytosine(967)-C(5))-methyltransferase RsmB [Clostridia bacterium]|nr:16S rRNA (cytosine(967)-C(5))-methyltransferase RsmB [Clostridia bacterium]
MNVREIVFTSLLKCEKNKSYPNIEIDSAIEKYKLTGADRSFYTALVYGVVEKKITLDYIISKHSSRDMAKIDTEILVILRMGVYQILYMGSVPDHAACFESVELCRKNNKKSASGFVNALLRETVRKKDSINYPDKEKTPTKYLSVAYSFPEWLCEMWLDDYGFEKCESILSALNCPPEITLRVNTLKTDLESVLSALAEQGIKAEKGLYAKNAVRLMQACPISSLEMLKNGEVFVQDEASQLCAEIVGAKENDFVIDTCSCPGGKSFSMAINMGNKGKVFSFDLHGNKLSLVEKGAKKLGIDIIQTKEHDGSMALAELSESADRVLVDVPCSGLGVIAKKPDLRYKEKSAIERLPEIQYKILDAACSYVKSGGVLVYSTCTVNKRENECVVESFLAGHSEYESLDFDLGNGIKSENGMITFYPDTTKTDGFFVSAFRKI